MTDPRTQYFQAARDAGDGTLDQRDVDMIHAVLDLAGVEREADPLPVPDFAPRPRGELRIGPDGVELIKSFEGCERDIGGGNFAAYPDPGSGGDPWTIGWGSTGPGIQRGTVWTQEQCDDRFEQDLESYAAAVRRAIGVAPTSQAQFDALVSFHYNTGAIATATLTKKHKQGDYAGVLREFARWNKAGKKVMAGLTRRRAAEAELYASGS